MAGGSLDETAVTAVATRRFASTDPRALWAELAHPDDVAAVFGGDDSASVSVRQVGYPRATLDLSADAPNGSVEATLSLSVDANEFATTTRWESRATVTGDAAGVGHRRLRTLTTRAADAYFDRVAARL